MWFQIILLMHIVRTRTLDLKASGRTVELCGIPYYVPPDAVGQLRKEVSVEPNSQELLPVTVTSTSASIFEADDLKRLNASFIEMDDVFQPGFLQQALYVQHIGSNVSSNQKSAISGYKIVSIDSSPEDDIIPSGPYFLSPSGHLYQAYRLYVDQQGTFTESTISDSNGHHNILPANINGQGLAVAVPSRLYSRPRAAKPLAGVRIGVKDIFDIAGLKTSNGNRAWYDFYPPSNATAPAVQRLLDAGAVLVGKMKTSQFAIGETATADWVDVHAPFNPRGDGYQDPSSSSAGPAAGIASYPWLDIAVGSDTGGSIRSPAQVNGVFGNRPSHDLVSTNGVMPIAPELDTVGIFARDPRLWSVAAQVLYEYSDAKPISFPSSILTVGFPTSMESAFNATLLGFLSNLTDFLSANQTTFDIFDAWNSTRPDRPSLSAFFNTTYDVLTAKRQAELVRDRFYADYTAAHDGRLPFVNPSAQARWAVADNTTGTFEDALERKADFGEWLNSEILPADPESCSKHLLVYVPRTPASKDRDTYLDGPTAPQAFGTSRISVFGEAPDIVLPVGELAYQSRITHHTETLPVTVDLMTRKGCDSMLFALVDKLYEHGIVRKAQSGRSSSSGGGILL